MFPYSIQNLLYGALGAASFELLKLYEIRGKIYAKKYTRLIRSPIFWMVVIGMIVASGFIAWIYLGSNARNASPWDAAIVGIAARSIVRQTVSAKLANDKVKLGTTDEDSVNIKDAFL